MLHLIVPKTKGIIKATDGHPYVRHNAQNIRITGEEGLKRLQLDKGINSFEDDTVNIAANTITNSNVTIEFILGVIPSAEPDDWMRKQNLLIGDLPVVAGVLLFAEEPQAALPKRSAIKIYRYGTREAEGTREQLMFDPLTIEGCIYRQISESVAKTKELIEGVTTLTEKGLEAVIYPHETLHEIITNAVLHRDYSVAADVHVRIYDNRIEVESPGRLPGHVTAQNILNEQSARNPKIVRLINKFPDPSNKGEYPGLDKRHKSLLYGTAV